MKFFDYEKPEGHSKGQTEVLVNRHVIERAGGELPTVNYDNLTEMMQAQGLGEVAVAYYMGSSLGHIAPLDKWRKSFHVPFSNTIHVSAWGTGSQHGGDYSTQMEKLLYGAVALSEARSDRKDLTLQRAKYLAAPTVLAAASIKAANGINDSTGTAILLGGAVSIPLIIGWAKYFGGKDARRFEAVENLLPNHGNDIVFPRSV